MKPATLLTTRNKGDSNNQCLKNLTEPARSTGWPGN